MEEKTLKKYEAIFILDIRKVDDEGAAISGEIAALIQKWGGEMVQSASLGRRQFAYEIKKRKGGIKIFGWHFALKNTLKNRGKNNARYRYSGYHGKAAHSDCVQV